jgi:hypothetical protein
LDWIFWAQYAGPPAADPFAGILAYYAANLPYNTTVKTYVGPSDPTNNGAYGMISYVGNTEALNGRYSIQTISDGSSNTMLFAEAYASCYSGLYTQPQSLYRQMQLNSMPDAWPSYGYPSYDRGPTFDVDQAYSIITFDWSVYPPTQTTTAHLPSDTFEDHPSSSYPCNQCVPQSLTRGVIQVGMADGSVRGISRTVSFLSWKAAITPAAGDEIGGDF